MEELCNVSKIIGLTLKDIHVNRDADVITFVSECGRIFQMYHDQDCCETVQIEDICGDLNDLIGERINMACESSNEDPDADESASWTFYKFATIKGFVDIRWYGYSNGYYSESVSFYEVKDSKDFNEVI